MFTSYNTGIIGSIGARIYYKWLWETQSRILKVLRYFLTIPFRWLDINSEKVSCELFTIYAGGIYEEVKFEEKSRNN